MRVSELTDLGRALDDATGGWLGRCQELCDQRALDLHMTVQTYHEGLPGKTMKLCFQAFDAQDNTKLYFDVDLEGKRLRTLGWNLYLHECMTSARKHLQGAQDSLRKLDDAPSAPEAPLDPESLVAALKGLLGPLPVAEA